MMRKIVLSLVCWVAFSFSGFAGIGDDPYLPFNPEGPRTYISPNYFGPNVFPVPDILKNTAGKLELELNGTGALGHLTDDMDKTFSADFRVRVPLWTDRINLSIWGQAYECFYDNPSVMAARRVDPKLAPCGDHSGDVYISFDIRVMNERRIAPMIICRLACKTATGGYFYRARYYDAPGYFGDVTFVKNFHFGKIDLVAALSGGFLCWQVDNGRQNDAALYGVSLGLKSRPVRFSVDFGGYVGWLNDGDNPMTIKAKLDIIPDKMFSPFVEYQHGFISWPFDQLKVGVRASIDILKKKSGKNDKGGNPD